MKIRQLENINTIWTAIIAIVTFAQWLMKVSLVFIAISVALMLLGWAVYILIAMLRRPWHKDFRPEILKLKHSKYPFKVFYDTVFKKKMYESEYVTPHYMRQTTNNMNMNYDNLKDRITVVVEDDPVGYICHKGKLPSFIVDEKMSSPNIFNLLDSRKNVIIDSMFFFITTPSRRLDKKSSFLMNREIGVALKMFQESCGKRLRIISKIDSCLRSNYDAEFSGLYDGYGPFSLEVLAPAYVEQGRITVNGYQYLREANSITPVHNSEYSSFTGLDFANSNLALWLEKKNRHVSTRHQVGLITIDDIRTQDKGTIVERIKTRSKGITSMVFDCSEEDDLSRILNILLDVEKNEQNIFYKFGPSMINRFALEYVRDQAANTLSNIGKDDAAIVVAGSLSSITKKQISYLKDEPCTSLVTLSNNEIESPDILKIINRKRKKILEYNNRGDNVILTTEYWKSDINEYPSIEKRDKVLSLLSEICRMANEDIKHRWIVVKGSDTALFTLHHGFGLDDFFYCGHLIPGAIHIKVLLKDIPDTYKSCFIIGGNVGNESILVDTISTINNTLESSSKLLESNGQTI